MDISTKVKILVFNYDMRLMGFRSQVPEEVKSFKLLESILEKYPQSFSERCMNVSLQLSFIEYKSQNPSSTYIEFEERFLSQLENIKIFQKTLDKVSAILPKELNLESLIQFQSQL
jgi:hypothetical protein